MTHDYWAIPADEPQPVIHGGNAPGLAWGTQWLCPGALDTFRAGESSDHSSKDRRLARGPRKDARPGPVVIPAGYLRVRDAVEAERVSEAAVSRGRTTGRIREFRAGKIIYVCLEDVREIAAEVAAWHRARLHRRRSA